MVDIMVISALIGQDYAFEARLVAGSDLLMSAQYGQKTNVMMCLICYFEHHLGNTVSLAIEIASSDLVPQHVWDEFKVCARYSDYYAMLRISCRLPWPATGGVTRTVRATL